MSARTYRHALWSGEARRANKEVVRLTSTSVPFFNGSVHWQVASQSNQSGCWTKKALAAFEVDAWSWESLQNTNSSPAKQTAVFFCQNRLSWWGEKVDFGSFSAARRSFISMAAHFHDYMIFEVVWNKYVSNLFPEISQKVIFYPWRPLDDVYS